MPTVQKTFTLVPRAGTAYNHNNLPSPANPSRPVTSKQIAKAYRAANRVPRVSKAEARRQEKEEQERIKREFEKEKASAKAKLARERKKEKDAELAKKDKEEKKKKGLPLCKVRPSQDTIARFVRGNGGGKKRDGMGDVVGQPDVKTTNEESKDLDHAIEDEISENIEDVVEEPPEIPVEEQAEDPEGEILGDEPYDDKIDKVDDKPRNPAISFDESFIIADDELEMEMQSEGTPTTPKIGDQISDIPRKPMAGSVQARENTQIEEANRAVATVTASTTWDDIDLLSTQNNLDFTFDALDDLEQKAMKKKEPVSQRRQHESMEAHDLGLTTKQASRKPHTVSSMGPPPLPVAFAKRHVTVSKPEPPPLLPMAPPPMSTQAIFYHLDEFFPSSSQQARELREDDVLETPESTHSASIQQDLDEEPEEPIVQPNPQPSESKSSPPRSSPEIPTSPLSSRDPSPEPSQSSQPSNQKRFFTSSGSNEMLHLAMQRSRRDAAREKLHERERIRFEAGVVKNSFEELERSRRKKAKFSNGAFEIRPDAEEAWVPPHHPSLEGNAVLAKPPAQAAAQNETNSSTKTGLISLRPKAGALDTENIPPAPMASQESEYGGNWMDDIAHDLVYDDFGEFA